MRILAPISLLTLALAACVAPPAPVQAPPPAPALPPPAPPAVEPAGDWRDRPLTPGDWRYRPEQGGSVALFGPSAGEAALSIRCEIASRHIRIARSGTLAPGNGQMTIRSTFGVVQWPAGNGSGAIPHVVAIRSAGDAALDQIAFSRGRFAVEVPGLAPLVVPAWPEVARVIEDCRG